MILYKDIIENGLKELESLKDGTYSRKRYDGKIKYDLTKFIFKKNNKFSNMLLVIETSKPKKKEKVEIKKEEDIIDIIKDLEEPLDILTTESENRIYEKKVCQGCNSEKLIEDQQASLIVCADCGMINEELLDHGPEWRQFNNDECKGEGMNRCGCPSNFFFPKSSQGTIISGTSNSRLKRKQKWNSMVYKERSLNQVFEYIGNLCDTNNIPRIISDSAKFLYKKISDCKHKTGINEGKQIIIRGKNRISIIASCVFKACEMNKNPRNIKEIAAMFNIDEKKITKGNKQFEKIIKNSSDTSILNQFNSDTAENYIRRHCPKLKINKTDTEIAVKISHNCCKMKLASDHNPQSIAAGSIMALIQYYNLNIEKKKIALYFGTSDVTINKIYNKIIPYIEALVDNEATEYLIKKFKING